MRRVFKFVYTHLLTYLPNGTAHPITASVQNAVLLYNGPLLCEFNLPIKRLKKTEDASYTGDYTCRLWRRDRLRVSIAWFNACASLVNINRRFVCHHWRT